ncbi:hypothetical protein EHQ53_12600 [Leptospira langatensis]|uniref:Uncharacterized protein n=1 Tax=Leptospira langatensis TaxID=2484983 RepID=A0A5F1ZT50_9LEPT|nr:hypothetical protein [Leptospira langatensis]TGK02777.1 hypothetical protein EHO57_05510 [Leptospira langatensis]TGL40018.1 hypothetical protein EHQ53_12600 [Leptospira langatensis]
MNVLRKILFWLGVFSFLLVPFCIQLADAGTCLQEDDSIFVLFTQVAFASAIFSFFLTSYGLPSTGLVSLVFAFLPFLISVYYYVAYVPIYFVYSTIQNLHLCAVVHSDLTLYSSAHAPILAIPANFFSRTYAVLMLLPVICTFFPAYRIWKLGSFSRQNHKN